MVRAGTGSSYIDKFRETNTVGIGWNEVGDLSTVQPDGIRKLVEAVWKDQSIYWVGQTVGQLKRFRFDISIGDHVLSYDSSVRVYVLGLVKSDYEYLEKTDEDCFHIRQVSWETEVPRDRLSVQTRNTLGGLQTVFAIGEEQKSDIIIAGTDEDLEIPESLEKEGLDEERENLNERSVELIKDKVQKLSAEQMEDLVAGLLRSMGYKTWITKRGQDLA